MRAILFLLVVAIAQFTFSAAENLKANLWQSKSNDFVNAQDFPESKLLAGKPNTAIGFTGGGSRAYIAAIGELAALEELGLIKKIRYIGGISGGSWATNTFSYSQLPVDDKTLLGRVVPPAELTPAKLREMDTNCIRSVTNADLVKIALEALKNKVVAGLADAWAYGVSKVYNEPVGITPNTRFSWSKATVDDIKSRNPSLANAKFLLPTNPDRPFPILGSTIVGPTEGGPYKIDTQNYSMIEFTPLYAGQLRSQDISYTYSGVLGRKHTMHVGGAVEPFAFARKGSAPSTALPSASTSSVVSVPEPEIFIDLAYAAAASSYAPGSFFESFPVPPDSFALPMDYWSPSERVPAKNNWLLADGGAYENIPLISFLQRKVAKSVLFFNSETSLLPANRWNVHQDAPAGDQISNCLSAFFGVLPPEAKWQNRSYEYEKDQVFAKEDYAKVVEALQAAQAAGNGIVASFNLTTIQNSWWGVPAGFTSEITFVYLGRLAGWEKQLSSEMSKLLVPETNAEDLSVDVSSGQFREFPHYATSASLINYERANVLADLTGWSVLQHKQLFERIFA